MTRRKRHHGFNRVAFIWFVAIIGSAAIMDAVLITAHFIGWLIGTAAIGAGCWITARRTAPAARNSREITRLRQELAGAQESANAAWDAAADRPPVPRSVTTAAGKSAARHRLINDPRSGARQLGNSATDPRD